MNIYVKRYLHGNNTPPVKLLFPQQNQSDYTESNEKTSGNLGLGAGADQC